MPVDQDKALDAACQDVEAKINRTDTKASLLLAFDGAVLAGLASVADKPLPLPAQIVGGAAILTLTGAAVLLLLVVRPNLGGRNREDHGRVREGFLYWRQLGEDALLDALRQDNRTIQIKTLSTIAADKFERLRSAVHTILAALALLLVTAILAVAG
ncbi:Pycsar system effector family protein [Streptomyces sp. NRRL S-1868]|uniref:Pycsar system effector family protein n=1 Tax=Streptomyces sp. NRRL S-1868 TaxID=1463892 RepID=UPI0004C50BBA|nr:Pycsar system effector family protein [Streptomyces sp. NRRL S-1868]